MNKVIGIEAMAMSRSERAKALIVAVLCVVYLLNLSGGWLEIPDCLPIVGNVDEVAVTVVLLRCLERMGVRALPG